jgi:hypothetical protein
VSASVKEGLNRARAAAGLGDRKFEVFARYAKPLGPIADVFVFAEADAQGVALSHARLTVSHVPCSRFIKPSDPAQLRFQARCTVDVARDNFAGGQQGGRRDS